MKHLFSFLLILSSLTLFAQHSIQSAIFDSKNGLPLEMANVRLLRASDSTFVSGCQSDINGSFTLSKIKPGSYILKISLLGYLEYRKKLTVENKNLILKTIQMIENAKMLSEIKVTGTAAQMVVKGDTTEFNATAFKTSENAVVEDLLKRLPGVEVSAEGKITVNGEEIKKIRVNGKKFFSDDVEMATKNIPADLIDKVQVLDQKSDMAQLTGFEDNDTERIINLTFKPNRKKGTFGNITGGAGFDLNKDIRYDGNMFLNMIDGEAQTAITAGGNNTNTTRSSRGRGAFSNNSGITTTQNFGLNNNTIINPKLKIGGDGSLNHTFNETINESNRNSYLVDSTYISNSKTTSHNENYAANLRLEIEWKPDTLNTFVFQPNFGYNRSISDSQKSYTNLTDSTLTSHGTNSNFGNGNSINGGLGIIYSHKFASKKGRTLTADLQTSLNSSDNLSTNFSKNITRSDSTIVDQQTKNHSESYSVNLRVSYVEPLWNLKNFLETAVSFKNSDNISEKQQFNKDSLGYYTRPDSTYSNNYENKFYSETVELNYRYIDKIFNIMFGLKGEPSQSNSYRLYQNGDVSYVPREVFNFAPTARFQFNFGKKKFARIDYRGRTEQPSISQLQPVKNNSNLMNISVGNPELNPDFNHSIRMFFNTFNDSTFSSFNVSLYGQLTKDALVTNSIYDASGRQYSQTVNSPEMPYSVGANVMFNIPLIQKRLHFNTNTSGGINQYYGYSARGLNAAILNSDSLPLGNLSSTFRYNAAEAISLTFTTDLIEIGLRGSFRYSNTINNLNPVVSITKDWSGGGNLVIHFPYNFNLASDINYTTLQGYATSAQNQLLWNASLDKTLFNGKGVISLKLNDILHQQLNVRQTIGDNYIQYNSYNSLTSYFLLSFSYKINKFAGSKNPADKKPDYMNRFRPDDDHPHHGDGSGRGGYGGGRNNF
jgi:hypothetical protein